jgi:hypothetical protein
MRESSFRAVRQTGAVTVGGRSVLDEVRYCRERVTVVKKSWKRMRNVRKKRVRVSRG